VSALVELRDILGRLKWQIEMENHGHRGILENFQSLPIEKTM
jgi:hypothetical protein